jgi:hypothetical protein
MPSPPPTRDEPETLDADMTPGDLVDILTRLKFRNGKAVVKVDHAARDYLVTAVTARRGK